MEDQKPSKTRSVRKLLIPSESESNHKQVAKPPSLEVLVSDALLIVANELSKYRNKTDKGITLDLKEARIVQGYMKSLIEISREARESNDSKHLEHLSDEELVKIAAKELNLDQKVDK